MKIKVSEEMVNNRIDLVLSNKLNETRSFISKHIKDGNILVNDKKIKTGYLLKKDDYITIKDLKDDINFDAEEIPLDIYYEDDYIIVVNKPSGMVVHPAAGNYSHTLVNALMNVTNKLSDINGEFRLGIVHRIDKDTSGLLLISKTNEVHRILSDDFKNKRVKRKYIALVNGVPKTNKGKIVAPIGRSNKDRKKMAVTSVNSKKAVTNFIVMERFKNAALLKLVLETGRTHQIRVHLAYINHAIINDSVYGTKIVDKEYGQMLHASYLGFNHPITHEFLEFEAPVEEKFKKILETFKNS